MASYVLSNNPVILNFSTNVNNPDHFYVDTGAPSSALRITQSGANTLISDGTHTATLDNFQVSQISTAQFTNNDGSRILIGNNFNDVGDSNSFSYTDNGPNTLTGTVKGDYISGLGGNDSLYGNGGNDLISGGQGDDSILAFNGSSTIYGGQGNDTINVSGTGSYKVEGDIGNDTINGGALVKNSNAVPGFGTSTPGNPATAAISGNSTILGGDGNDTLNFSTATGNLLLYGDNSQNLNGLGDGNDNISGGSGNDTIFGGGGADTISGGNGDDLISGNSGADVITVGNGNSSVYGGQGADTITATGSGNKLLRGDLGSDTINASSASGDLTIFGDSTNGNNVGDGNDSITGGTGNETVFGGGGNDTVDGTLATSNFLEGNAGNDSLTGGNNNDTLYGGAGNDVLTGGNGADFLSGDQGNNYYQYTTAGGGAGLVAQSGNMTSTADTIQGFVTGQDKLAFTGGAGTAGTAGNFYSYNDAANVNSVETAVASVKNNDVNGTGNHVFTFVAGQTDGYLVIDATATGSADSVITLKGDNNAADLKFSDIINTLPTTL